MMSKMVTYAGLDFESVEADVLCSIESPVIRMNYKNECYGPLRIDAQSNTLIKVFDFCNKRAKIKIQHMYDENLAQHKLKDFDSEFLKQINKYKDKTLLLDLINAALKLHVKSLFHLVFDDVAHHICGKMTSKEIGQIFETDGDYYHEEISNFSWAFNKIM